MVTSFEGVEDEVLEVVGPVLPLRLSLVVEAALVGVAVVVGVVEFVGVVAVAFRLLLFVVDNCTLGTGFTAVLLSNVTPFKKNVI